MPSHAHAAAGEHTGLEFASAEAEGLLQRLLGLSGSREWRTLMADAVAQKGTLVRQSDVLALAAFAWERVESAASIMEAINGHNELSFKKVARDVCNAAAHAAAEHSASDGATAAQRAELARLNREYKSRYGFIFLTSAFGRTPESILDELKGRLSNLRADEFSQAKYQEGLILLGRVHAEITAVSFPFRVHSGVQRRDGRGRGPSTMTTARPGPRRRANSLPSSL